MNHSSEAYGLWLLVLVNAGVFIIFAFSFFKPRTRRDWRSFGAFSAFIIALFAEMYGFPLTIYLLSGWIQTRVPGIDILSHDAGHLLYSLLGFEGNPHFNPLHILSNLVIVAGFFLLSASWKVLHTAQRQDRLAMKGPYGRIRHPQYVAFLLIMFGFLLQWPTILTLAMFPVLMFMYARLALKEESEVEGELGSDWRVYAAATPRWLPRLSRFRTSD